MSHNEMANIFVFGNYVSVAAKHAQSRISCAEHR